MQQKSVDVWVGLFVLLGALALVFLALKAGNLGTTSYQGTYPVITKFDNIGGLKPRAAVRSAGVVAGGAGYWYYSEGQNRNLKQDLAHSTEAVEENQSYFPVVVRFAVA